METMDVINDKYASAVKLAAQGNGLKGKYRQEQLSQRYTTSLNEIIKINCK